MTKTSRLASFHEYITAAFPPAQLKEASEETGLARIKWYETKLKRQAELVQIVNRSLCLGPLTLFNGTAAIGTLDRAKLKRHDPSDPYRLRLHYLNYHNKMAFNVVDPKFVWIYAQSQWDTAIVIACCKDHGSRQSYIMAPPGSGIAQSLYARQEMLSAVRVLSK